MDDLPAHQVITPAGIAALRRHPRFAEARQAALIQNMADYGGNRLLNAVFSDRGRFMLGMFAQYLHHVPLDGERDAGLTAGRLRALCAQTGFGSPGRASAILGLMRFAGYLTPAPSGDRRQRVLVPTDRLVELQRRRWARLFAALAMLMPEGELGLERLGSTVFEAAVLRHMAGDIIRGFRIMDSVPELIVYSERNGAMLVLMQLTSDVVAGDSPEVAPRTVSNLAGRVNVARAQVRKILDAAAADGFIERTQGAREPIVVLPPLHDAVDRFFAATFLYCARSIRLAIRTAESDG